MKNTINTRYCPVLVTTIKGIFIVAGEYWEKADKNTTVQEVQSRWVPFISEAAKNKKEWSVLSSNKKDTYTVMSMNNKWSCTCWGAKRGVCKHIKEKQKV